MRERHLLQYISASVKGAGLPYSVNAISMKPLGTQLYRISILESTQAGLRLKIPPQVNIAISQWCNIRARLYGSEIVGKMFQRQRVPVKCDASS